MFDRDSLFRTVRFAPYRRGHGATFTLSLYETGDCDSAGRSCIAYRLSQRDAGAKRSRVIFEGADFHCHVRRSLEEDDSIVEGLMTFLTLRPGDTDPEYFEAYTPEQHAFAAEHAESLSCEVAARFQCPECGACLEDGACYSHGKVA